ncbi:hypothetical protein TNCV_2871561 [Trichonephila clavipes]|nr:hypothetical protein TNCV_2871561 [Trichonephila clavipes]
MTFSMKQISFDPPKKLHNIIKNKKRNNLPTHLSWVAEEWFMIRWIRQTFSRTLWKSLSRKTLNHTTTSTSKRWRENTQIFEKHLIQHSATYLPEEVCNIILSLENRKAAGADQIKNIALKSSQLMR